MWTRGFEAIADGTSCRVRSSTAPRQEKAFECLDGRAQFVPLDCAGGIDVLGADLRTLADESASPDSLVLRQDLTPLTRTFVSRIEVVTLGERDGGPADELLVQTVNRAGGVTQHAVDAHDELVVLVKLVRCLQVLTVSKRFLLLSHDPRLDACKLAEEVTDLDDEIADDWKISERFDAHWSRTVVGQERRTGKLWLAVDRHAAAAADAHAARPTIGQGAINAVFDVVETVEDHPLFRVRDFVLLEADARITLRSIAGHL